MATMRSHPLFSALKVDPHDVDQALADDTPQREAKRRRIESIANQYLAGSAPFILSASLKGPFDATWKNPWAKRKSQLPSGTNKRRARQATRQASSRPNQLETLTYHDPPTTNPRQRERQAKAEAERAEADRRRAKEERRENRRQQQRKREERAAELRKDGLGKSPLKPVDLTVGASMEANYATSKEYGSREIRSSFTDEWLNRLGSGSKTPELSPVQTSGLGTQTDDLEATTPTRPRKRSKFDQEDTDDKAKFLSRAQPERHQSLVPERHLPNAAGDGDSVLPSSGRNGSKVANKRPRAVPRPRRDVAPEVARRQYSLSTKPTSKTAAGSRTHHEQHAALDRPAAEVSRVSSMHVNKNEKMLQGPALSNARAGYTGVPEKPQVIRRYTHASSPPPAGKTDSGHDAAYRKVSDHPTGQPHRRHASGFTPINARFSSPPAGHPEPALSTTPAGRPVLGVNPMTNNANPADAVDSSLQPRNEGVIVLSASDIHFQRSPMRALAKVLQGQENNDPHGQVNDESKKSGHSRLKRPLVESAEKCVTALERPKKLRKTHPLHASPTAINSPGFAYRKVSDPNENMPGLPTTSQSTKPSMTRKRRKRLMTFGSIPTESDDAPVLGPTEDEPAVHPEIGGSLHGKSTLGSQKDKNSQASNVRDLSTQAAIHFAQQEFQQEFRSPLKERLPISPDRLANSQQTRTTTPPRSQLPEEYTAVTPFKDFNKTKLFLADNAPKLISAPASTQELLNAASPFAFSTVKKNKDRRKRVSMVASPSRDAEDTHTEKPLNMDELAAQMGAEGDTTIAEPTMAYESTTPPTPKLPSFARDQPSSGLKFHSLDPPMTSSLKINPTRLVSGTRNTNQADASVPRLAQPPSSAPVVSALSRRQQREARRARSQNQAQSQSSQRPSFQPTQRLPALDDVDLDSAMDAADLFLESWNIDTDLRRMPPASSASKA